MKVLAVVIGSLTLLTGLQAEKVCESCILRQQSHKDDIKNGPYFEDTGFFTIEKLEGTPLAPEETQTPAPASQQKQVKPVQTLKRSVNNNRN